MRVNELVAKLQDLPEDAEVLVQLVHDEVAPIALVGGLPGLEEPFVVLYHSP